MHISKHHHYTGLFIGNSYGASLTGIYIYKFIHMCLYVYFIHQFTYLRLCMYLCIYDCLYIYIRIFIYMYIYIYIYIYIYTYIYVYIHMHVHTYMCIYTGFFLLKIITSGLITYGVYIDADIILCLAYFGCLGCNMNFVKNYIMKKREELGSCYFYICKCM
jgi:hypothetical protein